MNLLLSGADVAASPRQTPWLQPRSCSVLLLMLCTQPDRYVPNPTDCTANTCLLLARALQQLRVTLLLLLLSLHDRI
jgi:hypothetical protein